MAVIFDVDGTLLDTYPLAAASFKDVFNIHLPHIEYNEEMLKSYFGPPLIDTFFNLTQDIDFSKELVMHYRKYHDINNEKYLKVFPGIIDMLNNLNNKGIQLGVLSNKMRHVILEGFEFVALPNHFKEVLGVEDQKRTKPFPDGLNHFKKLFNEELIMVGDSVIDILTAKNANVTSIAVTWSLASAEELLASGADFVVSSVEELEERILKLHK